MSLPLRPRVVPPARAAWNVVTTLLQTAAMWAVFLGFLPAVVFDAENVLGTMDLRFESPAWRTGGTALFVAYGAVGIWSSVTVALAGRGTPWPFDTARDLVAAGPYRYVRNPMAMSSLAQAFGVALALGSVAVLAYAAAGVVIWNCVARPWQERDLEARFGESYRRYRLRVRCWRVRLRPYDPLRESVEPPLSAERTSPPGRWLALYDGHCRFCTLAAQGLAARVPRGRLEARSFHDDGVLAALPGVSAAACMRELHVVAPDGRVFAGAEAVARAVTLRPLVGPTAWVYYVPGIRLASDVAYAWIARRRHSLFGLTPCAGGSCTTPGGE